MISSRNLSQNRSIKSVVIENKSELKGIELEAFEKSGY
jgi:hypothetical protein